MLVLTELRTNCHMHQTFFPQKWKERVILNPVWQKKSKRRNRNETDGIHFFSLFLFSFTSDIRGLTGFPSEFIENSTFSAFLIFPSRTVSKINKKLKKKLEVNICILVAIIICWFSFIFSACFSQEKSHDSGRRHCRCVWLTRNGCF